MRLLRSCCVSILFFTAAAFAQFTTVSGTVTDPNGLPYAGGTIVPTLVSSGPPTLNGQSYAPPSQPAGLSTAGSFVMQLGDNTVLLPGGSTWNFHVCSGTGTVSPSFGKGSVCFDVTGVTISGSSQNIGATLSASALALTATFGSGSLPSGCSNNQVAQWNGTAWVCGNAGTGTVTGTGTSFKIPRWNGTSGLADSLMTQTTTSNANAIDIVGNTTQPFFINGTITSGAATTLCSTGTSTPPLPTGVSSACFGSQIISNAQATNATGLSTGLQVQNSSLENTLIGIVGLAQGSGTSNNELRGIEADSETGSAGAITNRAIVAWAAALGTTTTNQGLYAFTLVPNLVTLTNNYGAYIDSPLFNGNNGTVTHNYGLFIADQTTTAGGTGNSNADPHALVTAGTAPSSFGGALAVSGSLTTNVTGSTQCLHVNSSGVVSGSGSDCGIGSAITKNYEAAGNASNVSSPFFFGYNTLPDTGSDRCLVWKNALTATVNSVSTFTVDARPELAANIACNSNALAGTSGGNLLLPPGTINALVGQMMPNGANGLHVIGEGNTGVTAIKACANGLNGCSADMTLNGAGALTAVIGMGPTTPANGQDVVGSSFERLEVNANGVAGVMGAAMTAGQEMTSFGPQLNIKNSSLVQFDMGEGTNSIQNGGNLNNFYFTSSPVGSAYNPCPTAVTQTISTISNTTGGVATVTLAGAPTPALTQFGEVNITGQTNGGTHGVVYNGLHEIASVISSTSFTFNVNSTLADSATGNGTVQAGPIGIRDFTNIEGGGRPIWNGTVVATGCSAGTYPLAQLTASGGPLTVTHVHVEDATYGAAIGVDGNTKDITLDEFSPLTQITNGVLISNLWTTTNVDINHLITGGGGGTAALIDQINGNTLTPAANGHLGHYWLDQAGYPWTTANPNGGSEIAKGFDFYNGAFAIYSGGTANFSANSSGVVSAAGSGTFSGGLSTGAAVPAANTITGVSFIDDVNGNKGIGLTATGSAVDYLNVTNGAAGSPGVVAVGGTGTDSSVSLNLTTKGPNGVVECNGGSCVPLATGTSVSLLGPAQFYVCTGTCTVTPPVPAAGYQFCVYNGDNVSTVITLAALGSSARYENTARTAYGTAGTGTFVSGGAVKDSVCIVGLDATHYITTNFNGTWTAN